MLLGLPFLQGLQIFSELDLVQILQAIKIPREELSLKASLKAVYVAQALHEGIVSLHLVVAVFNKPAVLVDALDVFDILDLLVLLEGLYEVLTVSLLIDPK